MFMSIGSAYGAITISMNTASSMQNNMINSSTSQPLPEQLTSIYENITSTEAMQINLSANLASKTENYIIDVSVNMDTSLGFNNIALDGSIKIAETTRRIYDIDFSYQDGMAYFDMFNGKIAINTNTIIEPIISIMKILNIQVPELGMDLNEISPEMILGFLSNFTENKNDNGTVTLVIDVPIIGKLNLVCDLDYYVQEFSLPTISFDNSTSLTISSNILYPESVEIPEKIESDYVKVGNLLNVAETVLRSLNQENLGFDFNIDINGKTVKGQLFADLVNLSSMASIEILGKELKIIAIDNIIYIEYGNLYASFALSDFEKINQILKSQFDIDIPLETITRMLESIKNGNFAEVLNEFDVDFDISNIDLSILESVTTKNNLTSFKIRDIGDFGVVVDDDGDLKRLAYSGKGISTVIETKEYKQFGLAEIKEAYIDLAKLLPTAENAISIIKHDTLSGQINLRLADIAIPLSYEISKKDGSDIYANITGEIFGASLEINLVDGKIYTTFAGNKLVAVNLETLTNDLSSFLAELELDLSLSSLAELGGLLGIILSQNAPMFDGLQETADGFMLSAQNAFAITVSNTTDEIKIISQVGSLSIEANVLGSNTNVVKAKIDDSQFAPFESVLNLGKAFVKAELYKLTEGIINYIKNGNLALDLEVQIENNTLSGQLLVDLKEFSAKFSVDLLGKDLSILMIGDKLFLEHGNIFAKFEIKDLDKIQNLLKSKFGIDLPLNIIVDIFKTLKSDSPLAILAGLGLTLDLSKIDLAFFDGITVEGNVTTIPVEGIGTIKATLDNKVLANVSFVGTDVNANIDFVEFTDFDLAVSEDSYVELIKFLPTIENGIEIVECDTITGVIEVTIGDTALAINYEVDKKDLNDIYGSFSTNVLGADISAVYMNNMVYVNVADSFKLAVAVNTLPEAITEFLTAINVELNIDSDNALLQAVGFAASIIYDKTTSLFISGLTETANGLVIEVFNGLTLAIENGSKTLSLSGEYDNVKVAASIIGGNLTLTRPTIVENEYNQFETILDLAENIINTGLIKVIEGAVNYFKNGTLGLNFNAKYQDIELTGYIHFNLKAKEIKVSVIYDGIPFNVIVLNEIAYLEIGNIYAKYAVSELGQIEALIKNHFGLEVPLTKVVDLFKDSTEREEPLANLSSMGVIDLSVIDFTFFDNLSTEGDVTTLTLEDVGTATATVTNKMLTTVTFEGFDISASANFIDFEEISLSVSADAYIDLVKLLPTIENAITIIQSDSISGSVSVSGYNIAFNINKADTSNIYAEFSTVVQGANIKIMYLENKIYIHFAETIKLVADFETLPATINRLLEKADIAFEIKDDISLNSTLSSLLSAINPESTAILLSGIAEGENNSLIITLHDQTQITLNNFSQEIDFSSSIEGTGFSGNLYGNEETITIPTIIESEYIPLDDMLDLVEAFLNMAKLKDFHIAGTFDIVGTIAGINITMNVPFDLKIKMVDGELHAMFRMGEIPVIVGVNNDVPFITGDTNGGKNRYMTVYVKGDDVYIYREEDVVILFGADTRHYEKCTKITIDAFLADPLRYVQYAIGFSDTIMDAISQSILKSINRETPINLNNVVNSLTVVNDSSFQVILNAAELANNTDLNTITLDLGIDYDTNGDSYLSTLGFKMDMPLASIFQLNLKTTDTKILDYGKPVDMTEFYEYVNNYTYKYEAEWEANNGAWTKASETIYTINFEENGGKEVENISKAFGTPISLPILPDIETDNGSFKTIKTFAGWYTTETFEEGTLFEATTMPRGDKTLYAKWNEKVIYYRTISFVTDSSETAEPITALEGSEIILPSLSLKEVETESALTIYSFAGWFIDKALTEEFIDYIMPSENITLYAKWEVADITEAKLFELYDNGQVIYSRYIISGREIDLSKVAKVNSTTKFYLASNYSTLYEGDFIMPEQNLAIHIRNQYLLKVTSTMGNEVNSEVYYWQGESITIPEQKSWVEDDHTTQQVTFTFNGYKVNGTIADVPAVMASTNLTIEASWTVTTKHYYTVSFVTQWTKPDEWLDNGHWSSGLIECKDAPDPIASVKVLEGTKFDPSSYTTTAKYKYQVVFSADYNFKILTWNTTGVVNISNGGWNGSYSKYTPVPIEEDTTLYPTWGVY